jgi:aminoglycoside 3-N-acetyltransferase
MIDGYTIADGFVRAGVRSHETLFVHSSFSSLGPVVDGPEGFIRSLLNVARNVVFPTFTYGFWRGEPWTWDTPSDTGVLGETARRYDSAARSRHPFYSVAAVGPDGGDIVQLHDQSAFGPGSIFRTLHDMDAWLCVIGLRYDQSFTFFHYVEQDTGGVPYRHIKEFPGLVDGRHEVWTMPVRNDGIRTWVEPMGELLHNKGAMTRFQLGDAEVKLGRSSAVYNTIAENMRLIPELMYSKEGP